MMNAVELTRELIAVESTNPGMGESDMERFILRYLHGTGAALASEEVFPGRNNVMATLTGEEAAPSLVFVCHMDTVVEGPGWTRDPFGAEEEDGRIYGRGACDMKAGLACALVVFREIAENVKHGKMRLKYPLKLLCTVDEEGTMRGAERAVLSGRVSKDDWVLDMEPTGGQIQMAHKGRLWLQVDAQGLTAHASRTEDGADAIAAMGELISCVRGEFARMPEHKELGRPTVTFGQIAGGYQPYVVPDRCRLWMDLRLVPPLDDKKALLIIEEGMKKAEEAVPGVEFQYKITGNRPCIEKNDASLLLAGLRKACKKSLGEEPEVGPFPGYTDTAVIAGMLGNGNCMSYGPGDLKMAHKPDEYVKIEDIDRCVLVLMSLVEEMNSL